MWIWVENCRWWHFRQLAFPHLFLKRLQKATGAMGDIFLWSSLPHFMSQFRISSCKVYFIHEFEFFLKPSPRPLLRNNSVFYWLQTKRPFHRSACCTYSETTGHILFLIASTKPVQICSTQQRFRRELIEISANIPPRSLVHSSILRKKIK